MLSSLVHAVLDILFPPSEDEYLVRLETPESFRRHYKPALFEGIQTLASFQNPTLRAAFHLNKFHNNVHAQRLLAVLLATYLASYEEPVLLIPIPLSKQRQRARGHNQVSSVLEKLPPQWCRQIRKEVLMKTHDTASQTSLDRSARLSNVHNVFAVTKKGAAVIKGAHILLVDDVCTTGATLTEAKSTISAYSPLSVTAIALAH